MSDKNQHKGLRIGKDGSFSISDLDRLKDTFRKSYSDAPSLNPKPMASVVTNPTTNATVNSTIAPTPKPFIPPRNK